MAQHATCGCWGAHASQWPGFCAGRHWPRKAVSILSALTRSKPETVYSCARTPVAPFVIALAALAVTASDFGHPPAEVIACVNEMGHAAGSGMLSCAAAGMMHESGTSAETPRWLNMARDLQSQVHQPVGHSAASCAAACGTTRTFTVMGSITGHSMLLGIKCVETRGWRLKKGWWNVHVGARDAPDEVDGMANLEDKCLF